jgi:hypothetical protein
MTDVPKKLVVDLATGIQQYIDLTPEEIQQRELDAIAAATDKAEREAEEAAKAAAKQNAQDKLKSLGLSDAEVAAITGGI